MASNQHAPLPFSVVRDRRRYDADTMVRSDDDSELGRRFRYLSRFPDQLRYPQFEDPYDLVATPAQLEGTYDLVETAAWAGDLEFLEYMRESHGGVLYDSDHVQTALDAGHIEFLILYIELSIGSMLQDEPDRFRNRYTFVHGGYNNLERNEAIVVLNLRHLYDHVYPVLPLTEELRQYFQVVAPRVLEREGKEKLEYLLSASVRCRRILPALQRYLVEERGLRFRADDFAQASRRFVRSQYEFVLAHTRDVDDFDSREEGLSILRESYPLKPVTDCVLLEQISCSFSCLHNALFEQLQRDAEQEHIAELLLSGPNLVRKAVYLAKFLPTSRGFKNDQLRDKLRREQYGFDGIPECIGTQQYIIDMANFLHDVLKNMQIRGVLDIDWSDECEVCFKEYFAIYETGYRLV